MSVEIIPLSREGPHRGRGPRGWRPDDGRLLEEVCDRLAEDPWVDPSDVAVKVEDGVVTLEGSVKSQLEKRRAEDIAAAVRGVHDVMNHLRAKPVFEGGEEHLDPTVRIDQGPQR